MARAKSRKALLVVLGALGAIPVASGLTAILGGPERAPGGAPATPSVDSEYRFVNTFWTAAGLVLWWSIRRPDQRSTTTRLVLATAAAGGVPRLISARRTGAPHPVFRAATVLELLVLPVVLVWHAVVVRGEGQAPKKPRTPSTTRSTSASVSDGNRGSDSSCS
ncbi:DUF4345 domain-containing protein [Amycolatopsis rhabdoformis]|uniref:DUF4345 domain-containing protein n=1 Tax=Amycolatopsis rhabdoformis TaxID=1448059 RepID=A0ABZ1I2P7_9PSEU|nr:DUF4345 domain-containing protein [Amycolatopsis rhabdoformis]WSE28650.1 DUF4345 domain-containing protein [Amycolatopsis rhabdoformis]